MDPECRRAREFFLEDSKAAFEFSGMEARSPFGAHDDDEELSALGG